MIDTIRERIRDSIRWQKPSRENVLSRLSLNETQREGLRKELGEKLISYGEKCKTDSAKLQMLGEVFGVFDDVKDLIDEERINLPEVSLPRVLPQIKLRAQFANAFSGLPLGLGIIDRKYMDYPDNVTALTEITLDILKGRYQSKDDIAKEIERVRDEGKAESAVIAKMGYGQYLPPNYYIEEGKKLINPPKPRETLLGHKVEGISRNKIENTPENIESMGRSIEAIFSRSVGYTGGRHLPEGELQIVKWFSPDLESEPYRGSFSLHFPHNKREGYVAYVVVSVKYLSPTHFLAEVSMHETLANNSHGGYSIDFNTEGEKVVAESHQLPDSFSHEKDPQIKEHDNDLDPEARRKAAALVRAEGRPVKIVREVSSKELLDHVSASSVGLKRKLDLEKTMGVKPEEKYDQNTSSHYYEQKRLADEAFQREMQELVSQIPRLVTSERQAMEFLATALNSVIGLENVIDTENTQNEEYEVKSVFAHQE